MRIVSNFLLGDPSLWGAMNFFSAVANYDKVIAIIPDNQPIQTFDDYYYAVSSFFAGTWTKPEFVNESNFIDHEDDLNVPFRLIVDKFDRRPIKSLEKENMICCSFIVKDVPENDLRVSFDKDHINILLDHMDSYDLGDTRNNTAEQLIRKFEAIQRSKMYIGSYCSWDSIAAAIFHIPTLFVFPKNPLIHFKPREHKQGDGKYEYYEKQWYKYGRT